MPSSQPPARVDMQSQVDSLNATVSSLAENLSARLDALAASFLSPNLSQLSSQTRLEPDVGQPQPGVTTGTRRTFQALGVADRTSGVHYPYAHVGQDVRASPPEQSGPSAAPQPHAAPGAAPPPSASFVPPQPPPRPMGIRLPDLQHRVGFLQALHHLALLVTPRRSRRLVKRRVMSPVETPHRLGWLTSFMRSALTRVRF